MNVKEAYNHWSIQYDTNENKTRDLEALSLRETLSDFSFNSILELGCGTGKNTEWLVEKTKHLTSVDFSEEMLAQAKAKVTSDKVEFYQADLTEGWHFIKQPYELVTFSLVLEHIENLDLIFEKVAHALTKGGYLYIGELHPFKQYSGSKARFETAEGTQVVTCFTHHISEFTQAASNHGFEIVSLNEYFDDDDRTGIPRILTFLFKRIS
ncbi:SAM-dependent methyltransferase [Siphonobacter sp. SORGH_AS_0500]|uniref:class I SAM-dependent DNA methyltransferase n=1 Tax=Siphonobacter sp. SORGH_AS_0500 TaxID=1864824 RepID=UPI000CB4D1FB|nr:methyltransferase domain-containing protein [Siphonobacter sp. SORGH_AS_0500]PKK38258.1 SAM-dependent methyltransferase [Siphonobacter sp. SORGH_AS_0500]